MLKMYCIFSKESLKKMNGIRGKLAAQAGHAYLHAYWNAECTNPSSTVAYRNSDHAYKICLVCDSDEELETLFKEYEGMRVGVTRVVDSGFTVFNQPTLTCIGIGPLYDEDKTPSLKALKVLS